MDTPIQTIAPAITATAEPMQVTSSGMRSQVRTIIPAVPILRVPTIIHRADHHRRPHLHHHQAAVLHPAPVLIQAAVEMPEEVK